MNPTQRLNEAMTNLVAKMAEVGIVLTEKQKKVLRTELSNSLEKSFSMGFSSGCGSSSGF